jgi:hypothetical protein
MHILGAGGVELKQRSMQTVVVYDRADGRIVHTHRVVVMEGGYEPPAQEVEQAALKMAENAGCDRSKVAILNLGAQVMEQNYLYRVDAETRSLVRGPSITDLRSRRDAERLPRTRADYP